MHITEVNSHNITNSNFRSSLFDDGSISTFMSNNAMNDEDDSLARGQNFHVQVYNLGDVFYKNGVAYDKNGKKFSGRVDDTLKSGNNISLIYAKGQIVKSVKKNDFTKLYYYGDRDNLESIVSYTTDGSSKKLDITDDGFEVYYGNPETKKTSLFSKFLSKFHDGRIELIKIFRGNVESPEPSALATKVTIDKDGNKKTEIYKKYLDHSFSTNIRRYTDSLGVTFINGKEVSKRKVDINSRGEKLITVSHGKDVPDKDLKNKLKFVKYIKADGSVQASTVNNVNDVDSKNPKTMYRLIHEFRK